MTRHQSTAAATPQTSDDTKRALRDFVSVAVLQLSEALKDQKPDLDAETRWVRGTDGHFREETRRKRNLWSVDGLFRSLPDYDKCVQLLRSDPLIGPHVDHLVGTHRSAFRLEADAILRSAIYAMRTDKETIEFDDERFDHEWSELVEFCAAEQFPSKTIAVLPNLHVQPFPLRLNAELELDRLTEDEITRCCQVGAFLPQSPRFPLIFADHAVGIRHTTFCAKVVETGLEAREPWKTEGEGSFGLRPPFQSDLVIDDVLASLRLFKNTQVRPAGVASWTDSLWSRSGTSYQGLRQWPYGGKFELTEEEIPQFVELWHLLEKSAAQFAFSIHRFNLAFERRLLADRIVDLVIAAESLFLGDLDVPDRGELRFRFALRAAKFIEHPTYSDRELFRVMRRAYDARSAVVHGGSPSDTRLPDNEAATLPAFIDAIEELVRLALRKTLSMRDDGKKLRQAEFWEDLILPTVEGKREGKRG